MNIMILLFLVIQGVYWTLGYFNPVHSLILETLKLISLLSYEQKLVHFFWIPTHLGILDSEQADQLATEGPLEQTMKKGIPYSDNNRN